MTAACWRLYYMMRPARRLCCVPSGRREMQDARMCVWKPHVENSPLIASSRTRTASQFTPCALLSLRLSVVGEISQPPVDILEVEPAALENK
jgi:hypothetical protein